jgi:Co/Zn/Cd efflux system component
VAGFVISFIAVACSKRKANVKYSYGYHRADVLGALATVLIIWALLVWLLAEATTRLINYDTIEVDPTIMLATSLIGFGCVVLNLVVLFCCCNEPKKKPEDEVEPHFVVDDLIARLKLGRGALLSRKSPGSSRSTPRGSQKIQELALHSINAEAEEVHEVESESDISEQKFVGYV